MPELAPVTKTLFVTALPAPVLVVRAARVGPLLGRIAPRVDRDRGADRRDDDDAEHDPRAPVHRDLEDEEDAEREQQRERDRLERCASHRQVVFTTMTEHLALCVTLLGTLPSTRRCIPLLPMT